MAKEITMDKGLDLFAATPPLEPIKALMSRAAGEREVHRSQAKQLCFITASKVYFHAPARRPVYVKLPDEALEPKQSNSEICGTLHCSLYGTGDAAQH